MLLMWLGPLKIEWLPSDESIGNPAVNFSFFDYGSFNITTVLLLLSFYGVLITSDCADWPLVYCVIIGIILC